MTDVAKEDDIAFASTSSILDNQFREDSPESIDSSDSRETESNTTTSDSNMNWIDRERKLRILEKIDVALTKYNEENDSLYVNPSWEDIFLEQRAAADDNEWKPDIQGDIHWTEIHHILFTTLLHHVIHRQKFSTTNHHNAHQIYTVNNGSSFTHSKPYEIYQ